MNKIFTLFLGMSLIALTVSNRVSAQFSQNFENINNLTGHCWSFDGYIHTTSSSEVITGTGSLYTNPPTNNSTYRELMTPYINITNTSFTTAFNYKLSNTLNGQSKRYLEVGLRDLSGNFTLLDRITISANTPNHNQKIVYNKTFTLAATGVRRLVIRVGGDQGDGNNRFIFDDLLLNASALYGSGTCNGIPVAANDTYYGTIGNLLQAGSLLDNDQDRDNEAMTPELVTPSPDGTVTLSTNGNFTFKPNAGFEGPSTTFTYRVKDNGYAPASSDIATVTLIFVENATLPVTLESFTGFLQQSKAILQWGIADNEQARQFEIQHSTDGVTFNTTALLFAKDGTGRSHYKMTANFTANQKNYYRLKMWDKEGAFEFSPVVSLQNNRDEDRQQLLVWQPSANTLAFRVNIAAAENLKLSVIDLAGKTVYQQLVQATQGKQQYNVSLPVQLKPGIYLVHLQGAHLTGTGKLMMQ